MRRAELILSLLLLGPPAAVMAQQRVGFEKPGPGVWISVEEVQRLPMEGEAWRSLRKAARDPLPVANIGERDNHCDVFCLAKALVYARTGEPSLRAEVRAAIEAAIDTEKTGDVLSLGRNLPAYVISAELVGMSSVLEGRFRAWLERLLEEELDGTTLRRVHERRPNNWGTHAGAARAVIARYLGRQDELARVAQVFRGWLGETSFYDGFEFGDVAWQADPVHPVGINPVNAMHEGHPIGGVLPDDQRRGGPFSWPPPKENYVYEALQGALVQAVVLSRAGYDVWEWGDRALLRAALWLEREADFPATGDDTWQPHVINHFYGPQLMLATSPSRPGKNVGWTDWTLGLTPRRAR